MNYFIYPLKNMRITQSYTGTYSHTRSWLNSKDYKDYPIDDGGKDSGREGVYCPCDEMIVTAIKGIGNNDVTNTIWLVSTTKVQTPTFNDYAFMTLTHSNDSDFKNLKVGSKFKRGQLIVNEGENDKVATHIHMTFGRGSSNSWIYNSNGQIVIKENTKKPEEVCYLDKSFTKVINNGGIKWVLKPSILGTPVKRDTNIDQIEVLVDNLRARKTANGEILGYIKKGIYNIKDSTILKDYTWYNVEKFWIAHSNSWSKIHKKIIKSKTEEKPVLAETNIKEETEKNDEKNPNANIEKPILKAKTNIFTVIFVFFKKIVDFIKKMF